MRVARMTDEEYTAAKNRVQELSAEIKPLITELRKLKCRVRWYEYSVSKIKDPTTGMAIELFGKRYKDLTPDERREYKRISTRMCRQRLKEMEQ